MSHGKKNVNKQRKNRREIESELETRKRWKEFDILMQNEKTKRLSSVTKFSHERHVHNTHARTMDPQVK